jgi:cysteine desulfurase
MMNGMPRPIYLDHNATTPVLPEVLEAMRACWAEPLLNPASQHEFGRRARRVVEDAREQIGELLGANPADRVVFTSSGTEANNLALHGLLEGCGTAGGTRAMPHLIVPAFEHASITVLADHLARAGCEVDCLGVDAHGVLKFADLAGLLRPETRVVAAMLAHNETGVVQPVADLAAICNERGVALHTDASQATGKIAVSFRDLGAATMSIAAHKFGGPLGIGALVVRRDVALAPQLFGGFQQGGLRPGTEPVALVVGLCRALQLWEANRREWVGRITKLRDELEGALCRGIGGGGNSAAAKARQPVIIAARATRLPHTSNIAFVGLDRQQLFLALDQAGVACSSGSACASGSSEPSPVHVAMGLEPGVISSALRFSLGVSTTGDDIAEAARRIVNVCNSLGRQ